MRNSQKFSNYSVNFTVFRQSHNGRALAILTSLATLQTPNTKKLQRSLLLNTASVHYPCDRLFCTMLSLHGHTSLCRSTVGQQTARRRLVVRNAVGTSIRRPCQVDLEQFGRAEGQTLPLNIHGVGKAGEYLPVHLTAAKLAQRSSKSVV